MDQVVAHRTISVARTVSDWRSGLAGSHDYTTWHGGLNRMVDAHCSMLQ